MAEHKVTKWMVPEGGDAPLLVMPNIPHDCHGRPPRTLMAPKEWTAMRKACYAEHGDICEICGCKCGSKRGERNMHQAHEVYELDYENRTCTFKRLCCICAPCHNVIHSGRAITMYKEHTPLWTKEMMLELAEHGFELVHKWNKLHKEEEPLRMFSTILDWLKEPSLTMELQQLIDQYEIEFYDVPKTDTKKDWGKWKLIYDGVEYYSTYRCRADWEAAMDKNNTREREANANLFGGGLFDKLKEIGKE